ncbi:hypothetical protein C8R47DRAFT_987947, partial [Mycena vitilis]
GRPRAKDLDDTMREYAVLAMDFFRCYLSTEQAFPDTATENDMVRRAWHEACAEMGEGATLTPPVAKLISSRGSQLRGELKTKIKPLVDIMYGFKSGQNKKTITSNRKLAEDLKDNSRFAFKNAEMQTGLYKHPIIQSTVNAMWFANRRDEGPRHPELFVRARSVALVLAGVRYLLPRIFPLADILQVENHIDERLTGVRTDIPFTANDYRSVYEAHVKSLEEIAAHTEKYQVLDRILKRLHSVARYVPYQLFQMFTDAPSSFHSGVQPLNTPSTSTFSKQVLDAALKEYEEGSTTDDATDAEE